MNNIMKKSNYAIIIVIIILIIFACFSKKDTDVCENNFNNNLF